MRNTETGSTAAANGRAGLVATWAFAAAVVLLPFGRASEVAVLVALLLFGWLAWRERDGLREAPLRLPVALFLAYWVPALLSAPDAVNPAKSWSSVLVLLRFAPLAIVAVVLLSPLALRRLTTVAGCVALAWALDACVQAVTGYSIGGPLLADRVSGAFGAENLKLGPALAVLSPFCLELALAQKRRRIVLVVWLALALAVLLAGERAGWASFALVSAAYAVRVARDMRQLVLLAAASVVLAGALGGGAYALSPRFAARVDRTLHLAHGDEAALDYALAGRIPIWRTAATMGAAHPINGVGVRGFRYAYADYATADDPWVDPKTGLGAAHPHQIVLELFAELGVPGLIGWTLGLIAALRAWRAAPPDARDRARAPMLALVAMAFPLNTHYAFYSNYWALYFWWLIALFCAALAPEPRPR